MQVRTRVQGADRLLRGLRLAEQGFTPQNTAQVAQALRVVSVAAIREAPKSTWRLAASIHAGPIRVGTSGNTLVGEVVVGEPYGFFVTRGRRAGRWPPYRPIRDWAERHGIFGFAAIRTIRRKIAKGESRSNLPNPFLERAFRSTRSEVRAILNGLGRRVVLLVQERNPFL